MAKRVHLGATIRSLAPPDSLTRITIDFSFLTDTAEDYMDEEELLCLGLRQLDWKILDEVLIRYPGLQILEIRFPQDFDCFVEAQKVIRRKLPKSVARKTQFSTSPKLEFSPGNE